MNVEIGVKAIAYGIPAMMILCGMFLLLLDYRINESNVIMGGLFLIIFGGAICILEAIFGVPHSRAPMAFKASLKGGEAKFYPTNP